jgi:flagella basal body P-ring formation protein FlgA
MKTKPFIKTGILLTALTLASGLLPQGSALANAAGGKVSCTLRKTASVTKKVILVSDFAECAGGTEAVRNRILTTEVGRAPAPGQTVKLDPDWILVRVRRRGVPADQIRWEGPEKLLVTTASHRIPREAFEKAFRDYIRNQAPWDPEEVQIRSVETKGDVIVPKGKVRLEVEPPRKSRLLGRVRLAVRVWVNGASVRREWVSGQVRVNARVWVLERPVRRGQVITAADLVEVEMDLGRIPAGVVRDQREIVGNRARRSIRNGIPIRKNWLGRVPLVHRGDVVTLKAESDTILISTIGVVRTDGASGDLVEVVNLSSKKLVYGRVVDSRTVKVIF